MLKFSDAPSYYIVKSVELLRFKRAWPNHNIPNKIKAIAFDFDMRGDLVDVEYLADEPWDNSMFDDREPIYFDETTLHDMSEAVGALADDVQDYIDTGKRPFWIW